MKQLFEDHSMGLERTDELPMLSEEALAEMHATAPADGKPLDLVPSVERLCGALESADQRWSHIEAQLEAQNEAIAELKSSLASLERMPAAATDSPQAHEDAGADADQALPTQDSRDHDNPFVTRIAALESYIAERTERWESMEQEVRTKNLRIVELEAEMEQRIARELDLEQRLREEGIKTDELRERIEILNRRLEDAAFSNAEPSEELTRQTSRPSPLDLIEEQHDSNVIEPVQAGLAELVCLTSDEPHRYVLDKPSITIGRAAECDIHIPTHFVSREHAIIRRDNGTLTIEDQASTNGVFVNAVRIQSKLLENGDWVTIGETQFRFLSGESCD